MFSLICYNHRIPGRVLALCMHHQLHSFLANYRIIVHTDYFHVHFEWRCASVVYYVNIAQASNNNWKKARISTAPSILLDRISFMGFVCMCVNNNQQQHKKRSFFLILLNLLTVYYFSICSCDVFCVFF